MQKVIIFSLLIILAFTACRHNNSNYLQLIENDWKKDNLKGRVKKIVNSYSDQNGLSTKLVEYNEKGFKVREVDSFFVSGIKKVDVITYQYDTINDLTLIKRYVNGKQEQMWQKKYDQAGNLIETTVGVYRTIYTYDRKNRVLEELNYTDTALMARTRYEYVSNGGKKSIYFDQPTGIKRIETYDDDTMRTEKIWDQGGDLRKIRLHKKDTAGHIIYAEEKDPDNKLLGYSRNYYNQYNDMVMMVNFDVKKNAFDTLVMKYTYDKTGNFIPADSTWKREITYW
ncbi:hypothetical protein FAM09_14710 [Niastella caeni]|uniref:RHS repeat protein n=1 Tax=Niastella caeni TaxID=2569763 RepID=A0A4S8I1X3_9BACT|nr:hypothetical protein [Niastella caeni]THU39742.1 hypothetical protein FAM09_14710 [Niastella caeni]